MAHNLVHKSTSHNWQIRRRSNFAAAPFSALSCVNKIKCERTFVEQNNGDEFYKTFRELYLAGNNTYNKIKDKIDITSEEVFDELESTYKREHFIIELLSHDMKFSEALNYSKYLEEETEYITMHKTKGSSI